MSALPFELPWGSSSFALTRELKLEHPNTRADIATTAIDLKEFFITTSLLGVQGFKEILETNPSAAKSCLFQIHYILFKMHQTAGVNFGRIFLIKSKKLPEKKPVAHQAEFM